MKYYVETTDGKVTVVEANTWKEIEKKFPNLKSFSSADGDEYAEMCYLNGSEPKVDTKDFLKPERMDHIEKGAGNDKQLIIAITILMTTLVVMELIWRFK